MSAPARCPLAATATGRKLGRAAAAAAAAARARGRRRRRRAHPPRPRWTTAVAAASSPSPSPPSDDDDDDIPVLDAAGVHARLASRTHDAAKDTFAAFYSSWTGCITTDPAAMVLPFDDHMVHRGHGVFDTAHLENGALHLLDRHLARFKRSMAAARVPPPFGDGDGDGDDCAEKMKAIILRVAAASGVRDHGQVRYYASAGPGGFALSREECVRSVFYVVVVRKKRRAGAGEKPKRLRVVTTPIPMKPGVFATTKTTNYLPNALVVADAIDKRADVGLWVTENGFVGEGPSMNVAFLVPADDAGGGGGGDEEDETVCGEAFKTNKKWKLVSPPTSNILAGCTVARVAELVNDAKVLEHLNVAAFEFRDVGVEEGKRARETMLIGSVIHVAPVVEWDGEAVGDETTTETPIADALHAAVVRDIATNVPELTPVPYELYE